jgi:uncharacterized protein (DUF433 family)
LVIAGGVRFDHLSVRPLDLENPERRGRPMRSAGRTVEARREIARRASDWIVLRIGHVLDELESGRDLDPRNGEHRLAVLLGAWRSARAMSRERAAASTTPAPPSDPRAVWRDRLVLDRNGSHDAPMVRGTCVSVAQVVSLVIDGWSWDRILGAFPELTPDDIRACLSYSVEGPA